MSYKKYKVDYTNNFKKSYKKLKKQGKELNKLLDVVDKLANGEELDIKYRDHQLTDSKEYINCRECHIEPDWLLVYRKNNDKLILLLIETGSHSELF